MCLAIGGDRCIHPDILQQYLNIRQWREWSMYAAMYGLNADRTDISLSHQTYHLLQTLTEGKDKRKPNDLAPQFGGDRTLNDAEKQLDELVAIANE